MAGFGQTDLAQSFKPSVSNITGAGILLQAGVGDPSSITISLYTGLPNAGGTLLGSGTSGPALGGSWVDVNFGSAISVVPETTYFLVFTSAGNIGGIASDTINPYSRGEVYANPGYGHFPNYDYAFRTSVNAVPEPSSLAALSMGD